MSSTGRIILAIALACPALALSSCVEVVSVEERPCPCSKGYQCCEAVGLCMTPEKVAALGCARLPRATDGTAGTAIDDPPADAAVPRDGGRDGAAAEAPRADAPPADLPPLPAVSPCANGGGGLLATYYDSADFTSPKVMRIEPTPVFYWGAGAPDPAVRSDGWSAILTGQLQPSASELFTFALDADDGARLWVGGELLIDWWRRPFYLPLAASLRLEAGRKYDVLVEYVEGTGNASLGLRWQSPSTAQAVIPQCHLFPGPGTPSACPASAVDCLPAGTPACRGKGQGLRATPFRDLFRAPRPSRIDATVSAYVDAGDPELPVSMRWEGLLEAPLTGTYSFYLVTAGKARLFLDDENRTAAVVEAQADPRDGWLREQEGTRALVAGQKHRIEVEHELGSSSPSGKSPPMLIHLRWKPPGGPREIIPTCFLNPPESDP